MCVAIATLDHVFARNEYTCIYAHPHIRICMYVNAHMRAMANLRGTGGSDTAAALAGASSKEPLRDAVLVLSQLLCDSRHVDEVDV